MQLKTMRALDYHLGRPMCFLASLWLKGTSSQTKSPENKRALFIELSEMGSAILADPALRWLASRGTELFFVIFERNHESLRFLKTVPRENIFLIRDTNLHLFIYDFLRFFIWTRRRKIDTVVDLELFSRTTSLMTAFSGAAARIGFFGFYSEGLYRGDVLTRRVSYNPQIHISKNFMALVYSIFAASEDEPFFKGQILDDEIAISKAVVAKDSSERVAVALLAAGGNEATTWVVLNCGGGSFLPQRRWPAMSFVQLAQMVLEGYPNAKILLTGAAEEKSELAKIELLIGSNRVVNFADRIPIDDLPALYQTASVMVTNDSGAAHFASVTNLPTFVFFGPETPRLYGALGNFHPLYANFACSPCISALNHRRTSCQDNKCLQVITPEQVYIKIAPFLKT